MSQKSSVPQAASFVSVVLKRDSITSKTVALQFNDRGTAKLGLLDGALKGVFGSKSAKDLFIAGLRDAGMLAKGHGHAGTVQKRMPIQLNGDVIKKPRLRVLDLAAFRGHVQKTTNRAQRKDSAQEPRS